MPAVFVHGIPDTYHVWDDVFDHLTRTDVLALALPGFESPVPEGFTATKEEYVDWIIARLGEIGSPVDLVGHDWGSAFTARVASLRPDLVRTWAGGDVAISAAFEWSALSKIWQTPGVGEQWMAEFDLSAFSEQMKGDGVPAHRADETVSRMDATMKDSMLRLVRSGAYGAGVGARSGGHHQPFPRVLGQRGPVPAGGVRRRSRKERQGHEPCPAGQRSLAASPAAAGSRRRTDTALGKRPGLEPVSGPFHGTGRLLTGSEHRTATRSGLAGPRRREGTSEIELMTQLTQRPPFGEDSPTSGSQAVDRVRHRTVQAGGLEVPILEAGSGPLVLCLHGFPDHAASWAGLLDRLAQEGYWAVAPAQRGYWPSGAAPDGSYRPFSTGQDVLALIEALGREQADLIGHGLGPVAAYAAASLDATRVRKLVGMAVPYGPQLQAAWVADGDQQRRSWYMFFFQTPVAEAAVELNDFAFIDRLWREWSPGYELPDAERAALKETFRAPGVLTETLGFYRQLFTPPADGATRTLEARASRAITAPSLYLHGADDNCMSVELSDGMDALFTNGLERVVIPGAGHFLHLEQPKTVADHILGFLNSCPPPTTQSSKG